MLQGYAHGLGALKALCWILLHRLDNDLLHGTDELIPYLNGTQALIPGIDAARRRGLDRVWLMVGEQMIHGSTERVNIRARIRLYRPASILRGAALPRWD